MIADLESALLDLAAVLDSCGLPFVLIGGLAVALSGEPRSTLDVDVSVWVETNFESAVDCLTTRLRSVHPRPREFAQMHRVLPVVMNNGVRADLVFAALPVEREIIERGVSTRIGSRTIKIASVEDLIFMKLISTREKDLADARALLRRFRKSLDRAYLMPRLELAAEGLDRPDILETFNESA